MNELPEGWEVKKLGAVANYINGRAFKPTEWSKEGLPIIRIQNLNQQKSIYNYCNFNVDKKYFVENGDLLFAWSGTPDTSFGAHIWKGETGVLNQHIFRVVINDKIILKQYYLYALNHKVKEFVNKAHGTAGLAHITKKKFEDSEISLPPLPVQHAIVTKIEEIFSELDHGVEQLKTARQQLKVYRQAVLNAAIVGEAEHTIESVIESLDQGWSPKCHNEPSENNDEWAVIKTTAVQAGYYQDAENKRLPENLEPRKQHELKKGDLLITRAGPRVRVGICCLVKKTRPRLLNCDKVYRMRINPGLAIPEYVEMLLNSPKYSKEIEKMKTGISDSGVNLTQKGFLKILIPLPSLPEQRRIVSEIERRLSVCDQLEETIEGSLKAAEVLRAGVLKRAFEGRLVGE